LVLFAPKEQKNCVLKKWIYQTHGSELFADKVKESISTIETF